MSKNEQIKINSKLKNLRIVRDFVRKVAAENGLNENESNKVALAADEACANLIKHTYKNDESKEIRLTAEKRGDNLVIEIFDDGRPFDPSKINQPDMKKYVREYKRSGFGIYLIKSVMDEIEYYPSKSENEKNVLRLTKKINEQNSLIPTDS